MSTWNHRVVSESGICGEWLSVREVFYNDDGSIYAITENPVSINGETIDELRQTLEWITRCLDMPILNAEDIKFVDISDFEV